MSHGSRERGARQVERMNYQGLLLNRQKESGYFTMGDEDFVFVFQRNQGTPRLVGVFSTHVTTVKEIRDAVDKEIKGQGQ